MDFHRRRRIEAAIDMTPMIDTLLQLFVVFLLSMSFVASALKLDLPQASLRQSAPDTPLVVSIDAANRLFVNNDPVATDQLSGRVSALLAKDQRAEVLLRADRSLRYGNILNAMVEIQHAGAANVLLSYEQEPGQ
jgi:biopolymer transport protein ExbD